MAEVAGGGATDGEAAGSGATGSGATDGGAAGNIISSKYYTDLI